MRETTDRMLLEQEQIVLRHWLRILLEADEPDAMIAALKRIAERKASSILANKCGEEGMFSTEPVRLNATVNRWLRLAEALDKVEREMGS
jgi:hypothetical protein